MSAGITANERLPRSLNGLGPFLDDLVGQHTRPQRIGNDPLQFPRRYRDPEDQEVVALLAACLAWGRVQQIAAVVERLLARLGEHPAATVQEATTRERTAITRGIIHRVATSADLAAALGRIGVILRGHGSLRAAFLEGHDPSEETIVPSLTRFSDELRDGIGTETRGLKHLFPRPSLGSACKRWMLFLRWVVRCDAVDLGLWTEVSPAQLVIPLDTHVHRIARNLLLTRRTDASLRTALEITAALRRWRPDDPVACDFALSRLGIHQICPTLVDPSVCGGCGLRTVCRRGAA